MTRFDELVVLVEGMKFDAVKSYDKGNSAAGVRLRKGMLAVQKKAKEVRDEVQALKSE